MTGTHDHEGQRVEVVLTGRWAWLATGAWWAALLGACTWLVVGPPERWVALPAAVALPIVLARLAVAPETLTLEDGALVHRTGQHVARLPVQNIVTVGCEFVPRAPWRLCLATSDAMVVVGRTLGTRDLVRRALGAAHPGRSVHVDARAARWLGWPMPADALVIGGWRKATVRTGTAPVSAVQRAVLDVLQDDAVLAVAGPLRVAREDRTGWATLLAGVPVDVTVELRGMGRDPLAVLAPGAGVIRVRVTAAQQAALSARLPVGSVIERANDPLWVRAGRRALTWADRLLD